TFEVYANGLPLGMVRTGPNAFAQQEGGSLAMAIDASDGKDGVLRLDAQVTVTPARDTWYVVLVRGKKSLLPVWGDSPYAYTNPIYADVDGGGWSAPGIP